MPYKAESSNAGGKEAVPGSYSRLLGAPLGARLWKGLQPRWGCGPGGRGVQALPSQVPPRTVPWHARLWQPDWRAPASLMGENSHHVTGQLQEAATSEQKCQNNVSIPWSLI